MEYPERAECDFGAKFRRFTKPVCCDNPECGQYTVSPKFVVKEFGHPTMQFAFCSEKCSSDFYMQRLRS